MIGAIAMRDSVENEWLCLQLAGAMGLPVNAAEMARFEDQRVLIVTRFDRATRSQGGLLRLQ
jgi:serine/threonine-protein kinase HipA